MTILRTGNPTRLYWREWVMGTSRHYDLVVRNYNSDDSLRRETSKPVECFISCSNSHAKKKQWTLPGNWYIVIN